MVFKLEISRDLSSYYEVDLFPDQQLNYDVDFYDSLEVDKIKLPFSTDIRIPLTDNNKQSFVFNYDPLTSPSQDFPKDDFYFKVTTFGANGIVIEGILNVKAFGYLSNEPYIEAELKDFLSKYISELKDATLADVYDADGSSYGAYFRSDNDFSDFITQEQGTIGQNPIDRPIKFPYVDLCNDVHGKFGYAARQFTEYGVGMDRSGFIPTYSVQNFLTAIGNYLTANGFNTRIDSSLFGLNYAPAIADMQPEKLHMLIPSKLEADVNTNTREFILRQSPYWVGTNENLYGKADLEGNDKVVVTNWFGNMETFGNYGAFTTPNPEEPQFTDPVTNQTKYGLDVTNQPYPEGEAFGNERGYFAPFMSFNADITFQNGGGFALVPEIRYELPILGEEGMVYQIFPQDAQSTMTFGVFIGVYENGEMIKKIRLEDSNNDPIVLDISNASAVEGNSNKLHTTVNDPDHQFFSEPNSDKFAVLEAGLTDVRDMLFWNLTDLGLDRLYLPTETIEVAGESRYGINYFIEPIEGDIYASVMNVLVPHNPLNEPSHYDAQTPINFLFGSNDIRKAITRAENFQDLNIKFLANANFNPYFDDDVYNLKESLENTATLSPYEVLLAISKRFGCGLFYENDGVRNIIRIDPLHLVRSGSEDITELVDDLRSVKVYLGGDKIKSLLINNKDYGLYYDDENGDDITIGSTTQEINADGVSDLEIDLKSSIYYKSVAGETLFRDDNQNLVNGIVSDAEVAFTPNLFTKHQEIGLRFAYIDKPTYTTKIKRPKVVNSEYRPNIYTITQRIYENWFNHTFNGRLFHFNTARWNLMAEDEDGNTTDYYTLYSANEKIKFSNSPTIEFDMVVPTKDLASLDFFFRALKSTIINQSPIFVKSASGEVLDNYAYLRITGLLQ